MIKMRRQGNDREREARGQPAVTGRQDASEKRLRVEVATLVALMALFGFLSIQSPEGQQWRARVRHLWQERERARAFQQALTNDPPIGTPLERLGLPSLPFVPSRSLPFLVVVFGGCEGCGAQRLKEWAEVLGGMGDMEEAPKKCFGGARQGREGAGGRGKERVEGDSYRR